MTEWLWLIPALPLTGFVALTTIPRLSQRVAATIGIASVGLSAMIAILAGARLVCYPTAGNSFSLVLWNWIAIDSFTPNIGLYMDALSLVMTLVVTLIGFLVLLYSSSFMTEQREPHGEGYCRFFAYMNLFISSMLILVLADNLLLLYLGWEGVGLCSYLLIGFWYKDPANGRAAIKAFVVTRVGDAAMAVAFFVLFFNLGTLHIQELMRRAVLQWTPGSSVAIVATALLLAGAVGKSAQLPLQTWLPDAMAGPTPVSALIHAATMVTAGVYLIARTHVLFQLAPAVQSLTAIIGAATLILAACSALVQRDIKRVLAYSTMSQLGYMFLALGIGAWSAAMFHFVTHAIFKSLLFLAAGIVIASQNEEHDMFQMGGLRKKMPLVFWTFLAGAFALASLPPATAGFSKELILSDAYCARSFGPGLYLTALAGVFLTSLYTFRMVFLTFFGEAHREPVGRQHLSIKVPLVILAFGCLAGGLLEWPAALGGHPFLLRFLQTTFTEGSAECPVTTEPVLDAIAGATTIGGALLAYLLFVLRPGIARATAENPVCSVVRRFWFSGWGFDWAYERLLVTPFVAITRLNRNDFLDLPVRGITLLNELINGLLVRTQTGRVRWYAAGIAFGAIVVIFVLVFL
jgi:NADH-quinone oxidoreductase subunit L